MTNFKPACHNSIALSDAQQGGSKHQAPNSKSQSFFDRNWNLEFVFWGLPAASGKPGPLAGIAQQLNIITLMAKNKTTETEVNVFDFIESYVDNDQKKADSHELIELLSKWSGFGPKMWGPTIIGFGSYHYKYASGHEGDAPLLGFSPRKSQFSLYVYSKTKKSDTLLKDLGKFKMGKACIYFKKLSDINIPIVEKLSMETIAYLNEHHECACRN